MKNNFVVKNLMRSGNTSSMLVIPKKILDDFKLQTGDQVCIYTEGDKIIIQSIDKIIDLDGEDNDNG